MKCPECKTKMLLSELVRDAYYCPNYDCRVHIISKREASQSSKEKGGEKR